MYISRSEKVKVQGEFRMIREESFTASFGVAITEFAWIVLMKNINSQILVLAITEPI
jgi:hypothetical protein